MKPENFITYPWNSITQHCEDEIVAQNIMVILFRTENTWRKLTQEEYVSERKKDGEYSSLEIDSFDRVIEYTDTPENAAKFSPEWKNIFYKLKNNI